MLAIIIQLAMIPSFEQAIEQFWGTIRDPIYCVLKAQQYQIGAKGGRDLELTTPLAIEYLLCVHHSPS